MYFFIHNNNQFDYIFSSYMLSVPVLDDSQGLVQNQKLMGFLQLINTNE